MDIEGVSLGELKAMSGDELDALIPFGRPVAFHMGSAQILAEFNRSGQDLAVNLAIVEGGGEGVLLRLWKALETYAAERDYDAVQWNVHALTCAHPNPRLQRFLRKHGFVEIDHAVHGRILTLKKAVREA